MKNVILHKCYCVWDAYWTPLPLSCCCYCDVKIGVIDIKDISSLFSSLSDCLTVNVWVVGLAFCLAPGKVLNNSFQTLLADILPGSNDLWLPITVLWLYGLAVCLGWNFFCNHLLLTWAVCVAQHCRYWKWLLYSLLLTGGLLHTLVAMLIPHLNFKIQKFKTVP